jgi:integrase
LVPPPRLERGTSRSKRQRFLEPQEFGRLGDALRDAETVGFEWRLNQKATESRAKHRAGEDRRRTRPDQHTVAAIRLLLLTGARLREILDAQWQDVDLSRGLLNLRDSKTGAKSIYLSAAAQSVIRALPRVAGNPHLIPGEKKGAPRADLKKPWAAVTRAAKLPGLRIHDLRHSFASVGAGASLGLPIIGKLLGHSQAATTHRYAHLATDPVQRAVNTIGATISAAMVGDGVKNVVTLPKANLRKS